VNIELSVEELELICDSLNAEYLAVSEFSSLSYPGSAAKRMDKCSALETRLRELLREELALTDMPFEEEAE
jgi:hypothetical protein